MSDAFLRKSIQIVLVRKLPIAIYDLLILEGYQTGFTSRFHWVLCWWRMLEQKCFGDNWNILMTNFVILVINALQHPLFVTNLASKISWVKLILVTDVATKCVSDNYKMLVTVLTNWSPTSLFNHRLTFTSGTTIQKILPKWKFTYQHLQIVTKSPT